MKNIYCISGLGADERAFSKLRIDGYQMVPLKWLIPEKNESISAYAKRMSEGIKEDNPILLGLSFGGMMSIEIAKLMPVQKVILVSSIKSNIELPRWMKTVGWLKLNRILPMRSFDIIEPIQNRNLGITSQEEKDMVRDFRRNVPPVYLNWSINQVLNWGSSSLPTEVHHIHGDADRLFPIRLIQNARVIKGGGHFMIMNKADEVSVFVNEVLR